jgi:hypothetical protein
MIENFLSNLVTIGMKAEENETKRDMCVIVSREILVKEGCLGLDDLFIAWQLCC